MNKPLMVQIFAAAVDAPLNLSRPFQRYDARPFHLTSTAISFLPGLPADPTHAGIHRSQAEIETPDSVGLSKLTNREVKCIG
jgi:hypothetical protein